MHIHVVAPGFTFSTCVPPQTGDNYTDICTERRQAWEIWYLSSCPV